MNIIIFLKIRYYGHAGYPVALKETALLTFYPDALVAFNAIVKLNAKKITLQHALYCEDTCVPEVGSGLESGTPPV